MPCLEGRYVLGEERFHGRHRLLNVDILSTDIMVDIDDVKVAVGALANEVLQESEPGRATPIGYGWRCNGDQTFERLDIFLVYRGGLGGSQVGLASIVGLIRSVRTELVKL